jgi:hypothetical protein
MTDDRPMGLSEFESLAIAHWFNRAARVIARLAARSSASSARSLRDCAAQLAGTGSPYARKGLDRRASDPSGEII